ncbi:hypothetical protein RRG08_050386 [Elysia crispata]|uniref:Uncharacterized protein n=1 Tax=Elysia crispata TaxID=231223 RepID=A0AAE0YUV4_9GAST|nr:hypothetical protein RRG08_050386 [Elysia crispata]
MRPHRSLSVSVEADASFIPADTDVADQDEEQTGTWSKWCSGETSPSGPGKYEEVGKAKREGCVRERVETNEKCLAERKRGEKNKR